MEYSQILWKLVKLHQCTKKEPTMTSETTGQFQCCRCLEKFLKKSCTPVFIASCVVKISLVSHNLDFASITLQTMPFNTQLAL